MVECFVSLHLFQMHAPAYVKSQHSRQDSVFGESTMNEKVKKKKSASIQHGPQHKNSEIISGVGWLTLALAIQSQGERALKLDSGARLTHLLQSAALEEEDARGRATGINALDLNPRLKYGGKANKQQKEEHERRVEEITEKGRCGCWT